jgi:hypothetical protein
MTKTEKQQEIKNIEKSYRQGYADGLKAKSLELSKVIEKIIDKKTE